MPRVLSASIMGGTLLSRCPIVSSSSSFNSRAERFEGNCYRSELSSYSSSNSRGEGFESGYHGSDTLVPRISSALSWERHSRREGLESGYHGSDTLVPRVLRAAIMGATLLSRGF